MRWMVAAELCFTLAGCGGDTPTKILLIVDSDLSVPAELDEVGVEVRSHFAMADLAQRTFPRTLELRHTEGDVGPHEVRVSGRLAGREVVAAFVAVTFSPGRTVVERVQLEGVCAGITCPAGQTCVGGACTPIVVDVDAGTRPDAGDGRCIPTGGPDDCDGVDDDCNGAIDDGGMCPCEWGEFEGHSYLFCVANSTWAQASARCGSLGYSLVKIESPVEQMYTWEKGSALVVDDWWIGLSDVATEGRFSWEDGTALGAYANWNPPNEPNGGPSENCVEMQAFSGGRWNDTACTSDWLSFVCEAGP